MNKYYVTERYYNRAMQHMMRVAENCSKGAARRILREEYARRKKVEACSKCVAGMCQSCGYNDDYLHQADADKSLKKT